MEQPFKRRRVSRRGEQRIRDAKSEDDLWSQWENHDLVKEKNLGAPSGGFDGLDYPLNGSKASRRASIPGNGGSVVLHPRNLLQRRNSDSPTNTAVVSLIQVIVHSGDATPTNVFIPAGSSVFSLPGYGPVTLSNPTPSAPPAPSVPHLRIPASYSQAPQSTQVSSSFSQAAPSSQSSESPSQTIQPNEHAASSVASSAEPTGSTSMTINLQGLSSQQVISPSPSSPLPPSPASSESSSSVTGSFFPPSAGPSQSSAGETLSSEESQPPPNTRVFLAPTNGNFSISSRSTTKSSTSTGPTSLQTTSRTSNSKRSTSTISSSSRTRTSFQTSTISSTRSRTSLSSSLASSTSFFTSQSSQTLSSSPTITPGGGAAGGGYGGTGGTSTGPSSSATAGAGSGSGNDNTPSTPVVVGGVVGGLAGLSIILVMVLFLLRWQRKKAQQQRPTFSPLPQTLPPGDASRGTVTERSSVVPLATAGFFKRLRPHSGQTAATTDTAPSERGFQNFGGRKLESVLSSRGDGYGEPGPSSGPGASAGLGSAAGAPRRQGFGHSPGPSEQETLSGSSFYRDDQGFYGGKSSPSSMVARAESPSTTAPTYPPAPVGAGLPPEGIGEHGRGKSEVAFMRPGPARTPVTNQPGFTPMRNPPRPPRATPSPRPGSSSTPRPPGSSSTPRPSGSSSTPRPPGSSSPLPMPMTAFPRPPDELGRSHPSFDGSRGSRFTEEV